VKVWLASAKLMPCCATPMMMPPDDIDLRRINKPAMAFADARIFWRRPLAPKKFDSRLQILGGACRSFLLVDQSCDKSASIALPLPGIGVQGETRPRLRADAARNLS